MVLKVFSTPSEKKPNLYGFCFRTMNFSISKGRGYLLECSEGQEKALAKSTNAQSVYPLVASRGTVSESRASDWCLPELASNIMGVSAIRTLVGKSLRYKPLVLVFVAFDLLNYCFLVFFNKLLANGRGYLLKCSGGQIQSGEAL